MTTYLTAGEKGLKTLRDWLEKEQITATSLPDSVWDLPPDCPLWGLGLSHAQAQWILDTAKKG